MKVKFLAILLSSVFSVPCFGSTLVFEQAGFKISALESTPSSSGSQPLMMLLPTENAFSANVNVQIQPYQGTLENYKQLSDGQFSKMGFRVITSEVKGDVLQFEYIGTMNSRILHWYSRAVRAGSFIYLVTATSLDSNWNENRDVLIDSVNSFELN